jgi:hypothetical protein
MLAGSLDAAGTAGREDDLVPFRLGPYELAIPERYVRDSLPPAWLRWLPGLDRGSDDLVVTISADEVAAAVPGYVTRDGDYVEDIQARLEAHSDRERLSADGQRFVTMWWPGLKPEGNRVTEMDPATGLVRSYPPDGNRETWDLYLVPPGLDAVPQDLSPYGIASCLQLYAKIGSLRRYYDCHSAVVARYVAVYFWISEQNATKIDEVRAFLRDLVTRWQVDGERSSD